MSRETRSSPANSPVSPPVAAIRRLRALSVLIAAVSLLEPGLSFLPAGGSGSGYSSGMAAFARTSKKKSSSKAKKSAKKTSSRKSGSKKSSRSRSRSRSHRSRSRSSRHKAVKKPVVHKPSPEELAARARREAAYSSLDQAYDLYDAGINARLAGQNTLAITRLEESWRKFSDNKGYQKSGNPSTIESMVHYELGQAAEAQGDFNLARDSYSRCLRIRPGYTPASVKLVNLLARNGKLDLALAKAREAAGASPRDPRAQLLVSLVLDKMGKADDARQARGEAEKLLTVEGKVVPGADIKEKPVKAIPGKEARERMESDVMTDIEEEEPSGDSDSE